MVSDSLVSLNLEGSFKDEAEFRASNTALCLLFTQPISALPTICYRFVNYTTNLGRSVTHYWRYLTKPGSKCGDQ